MKIFVLALSLATCCSLVVFQDPAGAMGQGNSPSAKNVNQGRTGNANVQPSSGLINDVERNAILNYYHPADDDQEPGAKAKKKKKLPPGLKKKVERGGELPPGWQMKVARGEVLDEELYGLSESLPPGLAKALPPSDAGTELRKVGDKVVRILNATRTILDVLDLNQPRQ